MLLKFDNRHHFNNATLPLPSISILFQIFQISILFHWNLFRRILSTKIITHCILKIQSNQSNFMVCNNRVDQQTTYVTSWIEMRFTNQNLVHQYMMDVLLPLNSRNMFCLLQFRILCFSNCLFRISERFANR